LKPICVREFARKLIEITGDFDADFEGFFDMLKGGVKNRY
jgi:hypothetical protein